MKSEIEIFRTGTHTDMNGKQITVTRDDLVGMVGAYDPSFHEAPIVMGHPKHNDPAMGWVKSLTVSGDLLMAGLHQVNGDFSEAVDKGAFKKISASIYLPGAAGNPAGDKYGLRHVGFLGAQVPAIKGLSSVSFADDGGEAVTFISDFGEGGFLFRSIARAMRGLREYLIDKDGLETADKALPDYVVDSLAESANDLIHSETAESNPVFSEKPQSETPTKEPEMDDNQKDNEAAFAEREAALKTREDDVAKQQADFAEEETKRRGAENAAFLDEQVKGGKLASGVKEPVLSFMNKLDSNGVMSFGEQGDQTPLDFFKSMFTDAKPVVDFGEHTADDKKDTPDAGDAKAIAAAAVSFQEEQSQKGITIDIATAVRHVNKEG